MKVSLIETAFAWYHRLVAAFCLVFGSLYWIRLIGFYEGSLWRFDLMPVHWQMAAIVLAVAYPLAAIGLWMLASWGPVIWFIAAGTEAIMFGVFAELFGRNDAILLSHAVVAVIYAAFRLVMFLRKPRSKE